MLLIAFFLSLCALLLQGVLIPRLSILAFAPFLALVIMKQKYNKALWSSAFAGCIMDLLSDNPMGLHALNYTLITAFLFQFRSYFSHDHPLHLSLFTGLISILSTLLQLTLLFLFERRVPFAGRWIFGDLLGMPIIDSFYAFVWFGAPFTLLTNLQKLWKVFKIKLITSRVN